VAAGREVLDALAAGRGGAFAFDWQEFGWGCEYYARTGRMMAEDGLEVLKDFDAIYFGAVGWPGYPTTSACGACAWPSARTSTSGQHRPVHFLPGVRSPLRKADETDLDWVVVRENSEASTSARAGATSPGGSPAARSPSSRPCSPRPAASGSCASPSTWPAPDPAQGLQRHQEQRPAVRHGLWDDVFKRVAPDYPDVETESVLVDAMAAKFVLRPEDLSVVVASNLNADILSDLGSALAGSLGLAASANLNPEGATRPCSSRCTARPRTSPGRPGQPDRRRRQRRPDARPPRPAR